MYGQQYPGGPPQAFAWSLSFLNVTPLVWVCFFSRKRTGDRTCLFRRYRLVTFPPLATEISLFHSAVVGLFWRVVAFVIVVSSRTTRGRIGSVLGAWWKIEKKLNFFFFFFAERGGTTRVQAIQVRLCEGKVMNELIYQQITCYPWERGIEDGIGKVLNRSCTCV